MMGIAAPIKNASIWQTKVIHSEISFEVETSTTILLYLQIGEMLLNKLQPARALAADVESSAKQKRNVSRWETWQTCSKMKGKRNLDTSR
jgi:hypothetical protein